MSARRDQAYLPGLRALVCTVASSCYSADKSAFQISLCGTCRPTLGTGPRHRAASTLRIGMTLELATAS